MLATTDHSSIVRRYGLPVVRSSRTGPARRVESACLESVGERAAEDGAVVEEPARAVEGVLALPDGGVGGEHPLGEELPVGRTSGP